MRWLRIPVGPTTERSVSQAARAVVDRAANAPPSGETKPLLGTACLRDLSRTSLGRLHYAFHNEVTDCASHPCADAGREAVMKAGPNTGICHFVAKRRHIRPAMSDAGSPCADDSDLRNVFASECRLDDAHDSTAHDAMRAGIFRMHR